MYPMDFFKSPTKRGLIDICQTTLQLIASGLAITILAGLYRYNHSEILSMMIKQSLKKSALTVSARLSYIFWVDKVSKIRIIGSLKLTQENLCEILNMGAADLTRRSIIFFDN